MEIILIDDGSPDQCGTIADDYAKMDSRIVVIHQTNSGVSASRNKGIDIARGDYICIIDQDDIRKMWKQSEKVSARCLQRVFIRKTYLQICDTFLHVLYEKKESCYHYLYKK